MDDPTQLVPKSDPAARSQGEGETPVGAGELQPHPQEAILKVRTDPEAPESPAGRVNMPSGSVVAPSPPPEPAADGEEDGSVDYSSYEVGQILGGQKIEHILLQYSKAIVFTTAAGHIYFRQDLGTRADAALAEFYRLTTKSSARLKQAYGRQVNGLLGAALAEALSLPEGADLRPPFNAVDEFIDKNGPIQRVFGWTEDWVVFIDNLGELVCDCPSVKESIAPLLTEFYRLRELGRASLLEREVVALNQILGTELAIALARSAGDPAEAFSASRDFIQRKNDSRMRIRYVSASLIAAVIFPLLAWAVLPADLGLLLGCAGGVIGAAISVLQRSPNLEIRRFLPPAEVILQGGVRMTLGVLFGGLIIAAIRADLALGVFAESVNALFIAGVVAGFSERFVPDLLTKIAADGTAGKEPEAKKDDKVSKEEKDS